uniref:X-ray repair cross complementing 2 n=1 Tax=Cyprinus carpio TaxID=7962 RepID=A0A8C2B1G0_CYPCA
MTLVSRLEGRQSLRDTEPSIFPVDGGPGQGDIMDGSLEVVVVFTDTDYHLDMLRLVSFLEGRLERVRLCLRRLSVVHCNSSVQILLTLHYLENTFSSQPSLGLLVIDSISSFYWGESTVCQEANLRKCAELLPSSSSSSSSRRWRSADSATDFDKPYLCKAWQRIVTHRMLFTKSHVSKEHKQVFSTACTSIMIKGVKRCSFHVMEDGITFLCDK